MRPHPPSTLIHVPHFFIPVPPRVLRESPRHPADVHHVGAGVLDEAAVVGDLSMRVCCA